MRNSASRPGNGQNRTKRGRMETINRALILWGSLSGNAEGPLAMMQGVGLNRGVGSRSSSLSKFGSVIEMRQAGEGTYLR